MNKRYGWLLRCCLLPVIGLIAVILLHIPFSPVLYIGLALLCPFAHFFFMSKLHKHSPSAHAEQHPRT